MIDFLLEEYYLFVGWIMKDCYLNCDPFFITPYGLALYYEWGGVRCFTLEWPVLILLAVIIGLVIRKIRRIHVHEIHPA